MSRRIAIALLLGISSLTSCKEMTQAKANAATAIGDFHRDFNDGKFKELYASGDSSLKSAATEADFVKLLDAVNRKLGKQVKSSEEGWKLNSINMKTTVVVTQNTEFEKGKGTETFTYVVSGGSCKLQGYFINSQDMMTN